MNYSNLLGVLEVFKYRHLLTIDSGSRESANVFNSPLYIKTINIGHEYFPSDWCYRGDVMGYWTRNDELCTTFSDFTEKLPYAGSLKYEIGHPCRHAM